MGDQACGLARIVSLEPAEPLYKRVPTRDETGQFLSDFMMIIPGLKKQPLQVRQNVIAKIDHVLQLYKKIVVFANSHKVYKKCNYG